MQEEIKKRQKFIKKVVFVILVIGLLYGYILIPLGFAIHCPINRLTGLSCPMCGLTRICLSVMYLNFDILHYNYGLIVLGPIIALMVFVYIKQYIRTGKTNTLDNKLNKCLIAVFIILAITWMVIRNIYGL